MFEPSLTSSISIFANLSKDTGLFLLFNLMILSIIISSILNTYKDHQNHHNQQDKPSQNLHRSPSILRKLISLNFYNNFKPHEELRHNPYPQSHYYNDLLELQHKTHLPYSETDIPNTNYGIFEQSDYNFDQTQELGYSCITEDNEYEEEVGDEPKLDEVYSRIRNQSNNRFNTINLNNTKHEDQRPFFNNEVPVNRLRKTTSMKVSCPSSHYEDRVSIESRRPATMREGRTSMGMNKAEEEVDERATDFINRFKQQLRLQRIESFRKYKDVVPRESGL